MNQITIERGAKEVAVNSDIKLVLYYANNKGRGGNNVTIMVVPAKAERAGTVKAQMSSALNFTRTSAWAGKVNFSKAVQEKLGLN